MEVIADLQIHSKHARATSKQLSIDNLAKWAAVKGLNLLGVGDFQHPIHRKEIDEKLEEDDKGILWKKDGDRKVAFLWQTEVSLMYSQGGKRRAVHLLLFAPNTETADKITSYLGSKGRLDYDGRPIFGISCKDLVKEVKEIDERIEVIPAHCMTPWFGLFGSKSGFDSVEECFQDQTRHIYAIESGMSADPSMLWRFPEVAEGKVRVVSFSDAHSFWPWRIGREATIFEIPELSYDNIIKAIRTGHGLKGTIETPPSYGRYHWDGHRKCDFSCSPQETVKLKGLCPKCGKPLIIGVDYRVEEIAEKEPGFRPVHGTDFHALVPLHELIAIHLGSGLSTKKVWNAFNDMTSKLGTELNILMKADKDSLLQSGIDEKLTELIMLNRENKLNIEPGYDGEYGRIIPGRPKEEPEKRQIKGIEKQAKLGF